MLLLSTSDESEAFCGCCVQLQSDLCGCLPGKGFLILLSRDDLLGEFTQLLNVLTGIDLPEGCFKMESLLHRQVMVGHNGKKGIAPPRHGEAEAE